MAVATCFHWVSFVLHIFCLNMISGVASPDPYPSTRFNFNLIIKGLNLNTYTTPLIKYYPVQTQVVRACGGKPVPGYTTDHDA